jgi:hypothetical protein
MTVVAMAAVAVALFFWFLTNTEAGHRLLLEWRVPGR